MRRGRHFCEKGLVFSRATICGINCSLCKKISKIIGVVDATPTSSSATINVRSFSILLFNARAPSSGSKPLRATCCKAFSETLKITVRRKKPSRSRRWLICSRAILMRCCNSNLRKVTISSMRLRNSGRKKFSTSLVYVC